MGAWLFEVQDDYDWWKDYIYAQSDAAGDFDRIVMTYIKVGASCWLLAGGRLAPVLVVRFGLEFAWGFKPEANYDTRTCPFCSPGRRVALQLSPSLVSKTSFGNKHGDSSPLGA